MKSARMFVIAAILGAAGLAHAQQDLYLLQGNTSPQVQKADPVTGQVLSSVPVTGHQALFGGLAVDASGAFYSIDGYNDASSDRTFRIDKDTGAGTVVGNTGENWNFRSVCVNPVNDVLYATTDNRLYTIDRVTGAATLVANVQGGGIDQMTALAINSQGQAFATDIGDVGLFSVDLSTGAATLIGNVRPGTQSQWFDDLAFNSSGTLYGTSANQFGVYTINTNTAQQTLLFQTGSYTGITFVGDIPTPCYPDCNGDDTLNLSDFGCFTTKFALGDPYADCNGDTVLNLSDFGCFTTKFALGCP